MKKFYSYFISFSLILLCSAGIIQGMKVTVPQPQQSIVQPWYNTFISEGALIINGVLYGRTVSVINFAMAVRKMIQRPIMAINPDINIKMQKNKLARMEKNIRADEQKQIYETVKEHGLNDADIKIGLEILKKINVAYKESHNKPNFEAVHDKKISPENFAIIKETLSKENIDINNLSLINSYTPSPYGHDAQNRHLYRWSYSITEDGNISAASYSNIEPITITFFPNFYLQNKQLQLAAGIHEAWHIIEGHNIIQGMTSTLIGNITQKDPNDIRESESFQKLVQINERQAEVLPSLKDKNAASLMREDRLEGYYPGMLYGQHYAQLSDIDETHKMITYLEHIKKHPRKPMLLTNYEKNKKLPRKFTKTIHAVYTKSIDDLE